jgi:hypothetical protein
MFLFDLRVRLHTYMNFTNKHVLEHMSISMIFVADGGAPGVRFDIVPSTHIAGNCMYLLCKADAKDYEDKRLKSLEYARWRSHAAKVRTQYNLPSGSTGWTSRVGVQLTGISQTERIVDLINIAFSVIRDANPTTPTRTLVHDQFCNISQSVQRKPWGCAGTFMRSTELYSLELDYALTGLSMMRILGWPSNVVSPSTMSNNDLRELAGEAYSVPISSIVAIALFSCPGATFWKP